MQSQARPSTGDTRQRLLLAASRVFARAGLAGSTTRGIALEAGVNEVTLFRHFKSKDLLIAAVVSENFGAPLGEALPPLPVTPDLRTDLLAHASRYERLIQENIALIRTMIGEAHHHEGQERRVFKALFTPLRQELHTRLQKAFDDGTLATPFTPEILNELFIAMIFTGVLRRNAPGVQIQFSRADYLEAAVTLVLKGAGKKS